MAESRTELIERLIEVQAQISVECGVIEIYEASLASSLEDAQKASDELAQIRSNMREIGNNASASDVAHGLAYVHIAENEEKLSDNLKSIVFSYKSSAESVKKYTQAKHALQDELIAKKQKLEDLLNLSPGQLNAIIDDWHIRLDSLHYSVGTEVTKSSEYANLIQSVVNDTTALGLEFDALPAHKNSASTSSDSDAVQAISADAASD